MNEIKLHDEWVTAYKRMKNWITTQVPLDEAQDDATREVTDALRKDTSDKLDAWQNELIKESE